MDIRLKRYEWGDVRTITKFLWFPMFEDDRFVWLKRVSYNEQYGSDGWGGSMWRFTGWND